MNREIKFRVWDTESKCYRKGDYCLRVQSQLVTGKYGEEFPEFIVEQYTGLKDKNGKEVHEGDIIRKHVDNRYKNNGPGSATKIPVYRDYLVKIEAPLKVVFEPLTPEPKYYETGSKLIKVIGNVHENPELLRKG